MIIAVESCPIKKTAISIAEQIMHGIKQTMAIINQKTPKKVLSIFKSIPDFSSQHKKLIFPSIFESAFGNQNSN